MAWEAAVKHKRVVVGLDLAGVEHRPTGFCLLDTSLTAQTRLLYSDEEVISATKNTRPSLVCVDAPLWLPRDRCCLSDDCACRGKAHLRECDRALLRLGIKFFPVTLGPMRLLTLRGMRLRLTLEAQRVRTIESYPGAIQDILHIPRKSKGDEKLRRSLIHLGVRGNIREAPVTHHELDAVTLGILGLMHLAGETCEIGDPEEAVMVLPAPSGTAHAAAWKER
ncbi:MAG: DUF429 domain-containing protein [Candidatus Bathyarchaeia archaeon]